MLILSQADVASLLDTDQLIDALAEAMADLSGGRASVPPRVAALVQDRGAFLGAMPAYLPSSNTLESKLVSMFPGNAGSDVPTHQAVIVSFDPETGSPLALIDATHITEARTAAGSALATRLLARPDSTVLAILGTGVQAGAHARAVARVRPFEMVRIAGRTAAHAERLAEALADAVRAPVSVAQSFEEAMAGADVVCACTHTAEPVVRRGSVEPGMHITSVGYNTDGREVDAETVRDSVLVVESRDAILAPAPSGSNDVLWPIRDGVIGPDHVHAEVGELVSGAKPGRTSRDQITLYKSVGVGVQDAAAAALVLSAARKGGVGIDVPI